MIALVKKETPLYDEVVKQIEIKKQILNDVIKLTEKVWQIEIESIGSKWGFGRSNMTSPFSGVLFKEGFKHNEKHWKFDKEDKCYIPNLRQRKLVEQFENEFRKLPHPFIDLEVFEKHGITNFKGNSYGYINFFIKNNTAFIVGSSLMLDDWLKCKDIEIISEDRYNELCNNKQ